MHSSQTSLLFHIFGQHVSRQSLPSFMISVHQQMSMSWCHSKRCCRIAVQVTCSRICQGNAASSAKLDLSRAVLRCNSLCIDLSRIQLLDVNVCAKGSKAVPRQPLLPLLWTRRLAPEPATLSIVSAHNQQMNSPDVVRYDS